jgi:hypothetical protein
MDNQINTGTHRDEKLWMTAKKRFEFKKHLIIYLIVNIFLWCLWLFASSKNGNNFMPWPAYVTIGWGIGLVFQYAAAYGRFNEAMIENEYQRLKTKLN